MFLNDYNVTVDDIKDVIELEFEGKLDENTSQVLLELCCDKIGINPSTQTADVSRYEGYEQTVHNLMNILKTIGKYNAILAKQG